MAMKRPEYQRTQPIERRRREQEVGDPDIGRFAHTKLVSIEVCERIADGVGGWWVYLTLDGTRYCASSRRADSEHEALMFFVRQLREF